MLRHLWQALNPPAHDWRAAKASYGPPVRRDPADVGQAERVSAVLDGYVTALLDDVQGQATTRGLDAEAQAAAFRRLLPTTWQDVLAHVATHRLPPPYAFYEAPAEGQVGTFIVERDGTWHLLESERGLPWDVAQGSHADVTAAALQRHCRALSRYLVEDRVTSALGAAR